MWVRNCAGTTNRRRGALRTIALPGSPRGERSGTAAPAQMEAVARTSSVVADLPVSHARPRCSCDAGTLGRPRRPRRPVLRSSRDRDRGCGAFLNSVTSARFRLGSQEHAPRECPSRALLGPDVREGPGRDRPQQRRERHVRSRPEPLTVNRTREGCLAPLPSRFHRRSSGAVLPPGARCIYSAGFSSTRIA
jgi:hypothetical protein